MILVLGYGTDAAVRLVLDAADERDRLAAQVKRVRGLTYESDDGTRYGHDGHSPIAGYSECPGCWSDDILAVLDEARDDRRRQERDDDAQWAAEQTTADLEWDE